MTDQLTATIIPFPIRVRSGAPEKVEAASTPPAVQSAQRTQSNGLASSSQRLTQALAGLSTALADQKEATQRWKAAIEDLAAKMRAVGDIGIHQKKIS